MHVPLPSCIYILLCFIHEHAVFNVKHAQVPLGVHLQNENKLEEMVTIMTTLQRYVPTSSEDQLFSIPGSDELVAVRVDHFHHILLGGDQLTAARAQGAQRIRAKSETKVGRLKGLIPVVEDWHAKGCFLAVSYISDYCEYICNFMQLSFYVCTGDMEEVVQDFFKSRGGYTIPAPQPHPKYQCSCRPNKGCKFL